MFFFLALLWALGFLIGRATGNPGLLFFIGLFSIGYSIISYFGGAKMALAINRAKEIQKSGDRIRESIAPYSRFVRAEGEKLETTERELRAISADLASLRARIEKQAA